MRQLPTALCLIEKILTRIAGEPKAQLLRRGDYAVDWRVKMRPAASSSRSRSGEGTLVMCRTLMLLAALVCFGLANTVQAAETEPAAPTGSDVLDLAVGGLSADELRKRLQQCEKREADIRNKKDALIKSFSSALAISRQMDKSRRASDKRREQANRAERKAMKAYNEARDHMGALEKECYQKTGEWESPDCKELQDFKKNVLEPRDKRHKQAYDRVDEAYKQDDVDEAERSKLHKKFWEAIGGLARDYHKATGRHLLLGDMSRKKANVESFTARINKELQWTRARCDRLATLLREAEDADEPTPQTADVPPEEPPLDEPPFDEFPPDEPPVVEWSEDDDWTFTPPGAVHRKRASELRDRHRRDRSWHRRTSSNRHSRADTRAWHSKRGSWGQHGKTASRLRDKHKKGTSWHRRSSSKTHTKADTRGWHHKGKSWHSRKASRSSDGKDKATVPRHRRQVSRADRQRKIKRQKQRQRELKRQRQRQRELKRQKRRQRELNRQRQRQRELNRQKRRQRELNKKKRQRAKQRARQRRLQRKRQRYEELQQRLR